MSRRPRGATARAALVTPGVDDASLIVWDVRLPRMLLAIAVGAALAAAGALMQTTTRNELAEPGILGVTAGAGFGITLGMVLGMAGTQYGQLVLAVVGAGVAAAAVYAVGRSSPLQLLLAGVALSSVLAGISLGLRLITPEVFDRYRFWSVGSLAGREQIPLTVPVVVIVGSLIGALAVSKQVSVLLLVADVAARVLLPTGEVPVSIVTAVLGGPVLISVVRRRRTVSL
ncbi:iron chelate uptake ABC transporter family permease subunit [Allokutzneria sp. A3M-2-11 16]|nr:iron chelate uptake ABC transporter family permease subunit [Allokutzneria sp. A3M-2-11 16]MCP3803047.1 iron chelate uptake ABC transporter family permease subunit [Allokutzneria sp. A3M-2-11 16]